MRVLIAALLAVFALTTSAAANGVTSKGKSRAARSAAPVVRVYEPRPAPPLVALSLAGSNLIVWDDLDVDLFDDGDPLPPRVLRMRALDRGQRVRVKTFDRYSRRKGQGY